MHLMHMHGIVYAQKLRAKGHVQRVHVSHLADELDFIAIVDNKKCALIFPSKVPAINSDSMTTWNVHFLFPRSRD